MAGSKSNWLENAVLDHLLGTNTTVLSTGLLATVYVGLWNSTINDTFTSTSTGECAGSTYARVAVTNSSNSWTNAAAGAKENKIDIVFTTAAGSDWGTIQAMAILTADSTTTGNILYWADLTSAQVINTGNTVQFSTGAIDITED